MAPVNALAHITANDASSTSGGRLVALDGRVLPLESAHLSADTRGGIARVILEQRFRNPYSEPLEVSYLLPLPSDGAVSGFAFTVGDMRVVGEVDKKARARERFEEALAQGKAAALLDQERSSLFSQKVGNIPPMQMVVCEVIIDQRLVWLPEGAWEWRFPTVVGPRYTGNRTADAAAIAVPVADGKLDVGMTLALTIRDALATGRAPESPSHPLHTRAGHGEHEVRFAGDRRVALDRDIVVRWGVAKPEVGVSLDVARSAAESHQNCAYGLLTIVPPEPASKPVAVPRDLIFLIDTSGSMGGRPLDQARRVMCAMIDSLGDRDRIELIEFSDKPRRWRSEPAVATRDGKQQAIKWIKQLMAGGSTEMHTAVEEALICLRPGSQRQVVLITDGFIGFEQQVIATVLRELPQGCRVHTIGVGSAPNRSLTQPLARAGAGVELIIGMDEDAERVAARLFARTNAPLLTDVTIEGDAFVDHMPVHLPDLFAGAPALLSVKLAPQGGRLRVTGTSAHGPYETEIEVPALALGEGNQAIAALYGRELVEDLEMRLAAGEERREIDSAIERAGLAFQISTRLTSWVAITEKNVVDPGRRPRKETMPHELPYGAQIEGFGLREVDADGAFSTRAGVLKSRMAPMLGAIAGPAGAPAPARLAADEFDADEPTGVVAGAAQEVYEGSAEERAVDAFADRVVMRAVAGPAPAPAPKPAAPASPAPALKKVFLSKDSAALPASAPMQEPVPDSILMTTTSVVPASRQRSRSGLYLVVFLLLVILAAVVGLVWLWLSSPDAVNAPADGAAATEKAGNAGEGATAPPVQ